MLSSKRLETELQTHANQNVSLNRMCLLLINFYEILVQLYSFCSHRFVFGYFAYQRTALQSWTMPTSTKSYNPLEVTSKTTKLTKKKSPRLSEYVYWIRPYCIAYFGLQRCSLFSLGLFVYDSPHNNHTTHPPNPLVCYSRPTDFIPIAWNAWLEDQIPSCGIDGNGTEPQVEIVPRETPIGMPPNISCLISRRNDVM